MDEWAWQRCLDVNLKGTFFMSQLVGRVMADENRERGGAIINIGAAEAPRCCLDRLPMPPARPVCSGSMRECAREYADFGVRVNLVIPGGRETAVSEGSLIDQSSHPTWLQDFLRGRTGTAEDVTALVLALCMRLQVISQGKPSRPEAGRKQEVMRTAHLYE